MEKRFIGHTFYHLYPTVTHTHIVAFTRRPKASSVTLHERLHCDNFTKQLSFHPEHQGDSAANTYRPQLKREFGIH